MMNYLREMALSKFDIYIHMEIITPYDYKQKLIGALPPKFMNATFYVHESICT